MSLITHRWIFTWEFDRVRTYLAQSLSHLWHHLSIWAAYTICQTRIGCSCQGGRMPLAFNSRDSLIGYSRTNRLLGQRDMANTSTLGRWWWGMMHPFLCFMQGLECSLPFKHLFDQLIMFNLSITDDASMWRLYQSIPGFGLIITLFRVRSTTALRDRGTRANRSSTMTQSWCWIRVILVSHYGHFHLRSRRCIHLCKPHVSLSFTGESLNMVVSHSNTCQDFTDVNGSHLLGSLFQTHPQNRAIISITITEPFLCSHTSWESMAHFGLLTQPVG